jgi:IS1 family transposase
MNPDTRLFLSHHEGGRTEEDAVKLFEDVESKRRLDSPIPVFTTDNWDAFLNALIGVYGHIETPPYSGRGRPPLPRLIPIQELKYAQVCKRRQNGRVVEVIQKVVLGDEEEVLRLLGVDEGKCINTAYIERFNLTVRNCLSRFVRKSMNFSKNPHLHTCAIDFIQAWYNFVKPHKSLRIRFDDGIRKWLPRTPMMAEGLTDHVWSLDELLSFRVPVQ